MKISTIIIGILLFAIATMIVYVWGLARQKNQEKDLLNLLFSNGQSKIKKYMKNHDSITQKEAERLCEGLTAKLPFSQNKAVVRDTKDFTNKLLGSMVKTGQLEKEGIRYKKVK